MQKPQVPILIFLMSLGNVLGVLLAATLPELPAYFHTSKANVQSLISLYLAGCCCGQIIYAPIANAFGRKTALYTGGFFAILGSLLCIFSIHLHIFPLLTIGRFITALGASCGVIVTNTMLSDTLTSAEIKKIFSYISCGFAIIPSFGVAIGGMLTEYLSWQWCFYFMLFYACVILGACSFLPETLKTRELKALHPLKIIRSYFHELTSLPFVLSAILLGCSSIILFLFAAEAPFVAINQLHMRPSAFGFYNFIPNIGMLLGGLISARLGHTKISFPILKGVSLFLFAALTMWLLFDLNLVLSFSLFFFPFLIFFSFPFIFANGQTQALDVAKNKTYASSVMYLTQYGVVFLTLSSLYLFPQESISTMPILYALSGICMLLLYGVLHTISSPKQH